MPSTIVREPHCQHRLQSSFDLVLLFIVLHVLTTSVCIRVHLHSGLFPVLVLRLHQIGLPQAGLLLRGESGVDARLLRHFRDYFEVCVFLNVVLGVHFLFFFWLNVLLLLFLSLFLLCWHLLFHCLVISFSRLFLTIMVSLGKMVLASLGEGLQKWEGCFHSCRPQESGDKTSKFSKLAKLAKLLLKLLLWLLLLCFLLLRLLVLLRRRDVSQKLSEPHPGPATKEIGKHLDVWIAQNRVDLSCKMAPWGNSLARSRQPDHLVVCMEPLSPM